MFEGFLLYLYSIGIKSGIYVFYSEKIYIMNIKSVLILGSVLMAMACGTHASKSEDDLVHALDSYVVKVNENNTLGQSVVEGALTDTQGQEDIGTFTYYVNFDKETGDLCHVKNVERTGNTREEHYYYKDNKLVTVLVSSSASSDKKIYVNKGRIISSLNVAPEEQELLLEKGERFLKSYQKPQE